MHNKPNGFHIVIVPNKLINDMIDETECLD